MTRQYKKYLIFDSGGGVRTTSTTRGLRYNEIAYRLNVTVPDSWGRVAGDINITLPEVEVGAELEPEPIRVEEEL